MKPDTRHRARQEIMHYVLEFCLTKYWPNMPGQKYMPGIEGFVPSDYDSTGPAIVGDLVVVSATRRWSKWQIGWLREIDPGKRGWTRWLVESLEDGSLCWWENVSLSYFPRDKIARSWRWTDRQHAFNDKWNRVCFKERDAYIVLPTQPQFGDDFSVSLGVRTRFAFDDITPKRDFPDWRKVTKAMMAAAYDEMVAERNAAKAT